MNMSRGSLIVEERQVIMVSGRELRQSVEDGSKQTDMTSFSLLQPRDHGWQDPSAAAY